MQAKQGGVVGIALNSQYYEPYDPESMEDKDAATRTLEFQLGWYVNPLKLPHCANETVVFICQSTSFFFIISVF